MALATVQPFASYAQASGWAADRVSADAVGPVAYVVHTTRANLTDLTPAKIILDGPVGMLIARALDGGDPVSAYDVQNPAGEMAQVVAQAFALTRGSRLLDTPIIHNGGWKRNEPAAAARLAGGARYIVDVAPPRMTVVGAPLHWDRFDVMLTSYVTVLRADDGQIEAHASCSPGRGYGPEQPDHRRLMANDGELLKATISAKGRACAEQLIAKLHLAAPEAVNLAGAGVPFEPRTIASISSPPPPFIRAAAPLAIAPQVVHAAAGSGAAGVRSVPVSGLAPAAAPWSPATPPEVAEEPGRVIELRVQSDGSVQELRTAIARPPG